MDTYMNIGENCHQYTSSSQKYKVGFTDFEKTLKY